MRAIPPCFAVGTGFPRLDEVLTMHKGMQKGIHEAH
jgi:hypothetical protein